MDFWINGLLGLCDWRCEIGAAHAGGERGQRFPGNLAFAELLNAVLNF
jgi:hypothetical protein